MERTTTILTTLLLFFLWHISNAQVIDEYSDIEVILIFDEDASPTEIADLLEDYNLELIDGPTPITNAYLARVINGVFPPWAYSNPIDPINGIVENGKDETEIDAIGLLYGTLNPSFESGKQNLYGHSNPLDFCFNPAISINTSAIGDFGIQAGVFDTGIEMHPLFYPYYEDIQNPGFNFLDPGSFPSDGNGHGTHMTSLVVNEIPNNNTGVIKLNTYKTHDDMGSGSIWHVIQAIDESILNDFKVVNMSFSFIASYDHRHDTFAPVRRAIENAKQISGTLFIAAAGNAGFNNDDPDGLANYPASYLSDNILSVAAIDCYSNIPSWSNFGGQSVDIAAPGVDIIGLNHLGQWVPLSGTSPATAIVSRVAVQLGTHQTTFDYERTKCAILAGATYSQSLFGLVLSSGFINAEEAWDVLMSVDPCAGGYNSSVYNMQTNNDQSFVEQNSKNEISIQASEPELAQIYIFNALGQIISTDKIAIVEGSNLHEINSTELRENNIYFISVILGDKMETIKIVK